MYPIAKKETYTDGQIIFKEGSSGDWIYVVMSGLVEISKTVGAKKSIISILEPDEVFGQLSYFAAVKRTATARAVGETTLGVIVRAFFDEEIFKNFVEAFISADRS